MGRRERPNTTPKRDYCNFFVSYLDAVYELETIEQQADALFSVLEYMLYDIEPKNVQGGVAILFKMARPNIDASIRRQDVNRENGKKPKQKQNRSESKPSGSESKPSGSESKQEKERKDGKGVGQLEGNPKRDLGGGNFTHTPLVTRWFEYLSEKGTMLTVRQKEAIKSQIEKNITIYGVSPVSDLIQSMIVEGRSTIYFDRLEKKQVTGADAYYQAAMEAQNDLITKTSHTEKVC